MAPNVHPTDSPEQPELFAFVNRLQHESSRLDDDNVINRFIDRFPSIWGAGMAAGVMFFLDWSGANGCCRALRTVQPFADMWWHFFAFWAISWPFVAVGLWFYEQAHRE